MKTKTDAAAIHAKTADRRSLGRPASLLFFSETPIKLLSAGAGDITEPLQGEQDSAHHGTRKIGGSGQFGQRRIRSIGIESQ